MGSFTGLYQGRKEKSEDIGTSKRDAWGCFSFWNGDLNREPPVLLILRRMKFDIDHIADLARLHLTSKEKEILSPQLNSILSFVGRIAKAKTDRVSPTFQTTGLKDVVRKDKVNPGQSLSQEEALANAPGKKDGLFKVKPVQ